MRGDPDRGVGNPWGPATHRRNAPACLAGAAAADRRHPAHGRSINEMSHAPLRLKLTSRASILEMAAGAQTTVVFACPKCGTIYRATQRRGPGTHFGVFN